MAATAYGLASVCGRLRMDIVRTGTCAVASVTREGREDFTVRLDDGRHIDLYGYGDDLTEGTPLRVCVSEDGTWADAQGDASTWLLTSEPSIFPAAAAGLLVMLALYAGDGVRLGGRGED